GSESWARCRTALTPDRKKGCRGMSSFHGTGGGQVPERGPPPGDTVFVLPKARARLWGMSPRGCSERRATCLSLLVRPRNRNLTARGSFFLPIPSEGVDSSIR